MDPVGIGVRNVTVDTTAATFTGCSRNARLFA
jgi:hypothetical protein